MGAGLVVGIVSAALGFNGWSVSKLWLYLLGSALMILVGIQLMLSWVLMRVLEELSQRGGMVQQDLAAG